MNYKVIAISVLALSSTFVHAQEVVTAVGDSGSVDAIDMPEGMLISEEELLKDYNNANHLTEGNSPSRVLSYSDSVLIQRLSRIPTTIEMPLNDVTRKYIDTYSSRMSNSVSIMLGASNFYNPIFEEALERYGLPLELKYLPVIESALRPSATSRSGAAGLWQFMITTGKRYGLDVNTLVDERRDPVKSSEAAARYLRDLYDQFGNWELAIAAYNCGEGTIQKALVRAGKPQEADFWTLYRQLPRETRGYVPAFIAVTYIMNYYCEHGITPRQATLPAESDTVVVRREVSFAQIAAQCNVTLEELRAINPQYRRDIIPADYTLRLPASTVEEFLLKEDSIYGGNTIASSVRRAVIDDVETAAAAEPAPRKATPTRTRKQASKNVTVGKGDTLSSSAKRNGTTVEKLRKLNGLKGDMIHPGDKLKVK